LAWVVPPLFFFHGAFFGARVHPFAPTSPFLFSLRPGTLVVVVVVFSEPCPKSDFLHARPAPPSRPFFPPRGTARALRPAEPQPLSLPGARHPPSPPPSFFFSVRPGPRRLTPGWNPPLFFFVFFFSPSGKPTGSSLLAPPPAFFTAQKAPRGNDFFFLQPWRPAKNFFLGPPSFDGLSPNVFFCLLGAGASLFFHPSPAGMDLPLPFSVPGPYG